MLHVLLLVAAAARAVLHLLLARSPGKSSSQTPYNLMPIHLPAHAQVWECRSKLARSLIARRCIFTYSGTLATWLRLALLCVLCCLGLWGVHCSVLRPAVEAHVTARREKRRQEELARVKGLMERLRGEARSGQQHLTTAKQEWQRHSHKVRGEGCWQRLLAPVVMMCTMVYVIYGYVLCHVETGQAQIVLSWMQTLQDKP